MAGLLRYGARVRSKDAALTPQLLTAAPVARGTVTARAAGTPTAADALVTAVNPVVPATAAVRDLSVLTVSAKPYTTTITTPTGWTKIGETTNGTTASGADVGSMKVAVYVKDSAAPGAIGAIAQTGANSLSAVINTYSRPPGFNWDYSAFTTGSDAVNGTDFTATGAAGINVGAGDFVVASASINSDAGTLTAVAIAGMTGATRGTITVRTNQPVTTGNDSRLLVVDVPVTVGSSTAAPTLTFTNASSSSGSVLWVRLYAKTAPVYPPVATITDDFTTQDTVKWTGYGTGVSVVSGQLQIVPTGSYPTLTANGTYRLTDSILSVQVPQVPNLGNGSTSAYMVVTDPVTGYRIHMASQGGLLLTGFSNGAGTNQDTTRTYNATAHLIWRIRESGGNLYWEASSTGSSWIVVRGPIPTPIDTSGIVPSLQSGYYGTEPTPGSALFDNLNATYLDPPPSPRVFYVDPAGSDSNDGLGTGTAFQTLSKINTTSLYPGDQILLKRGATFTGNLAIAGSGTALLPIRVSSYGTGAQPIISGGGASGTAGTVEPLQLFGSYVTVDDIEVRGALSRNVTIDAADCVVQNCTIRWGMYGVYQTPNADRAKILHNNVIDTNVLDLGPGPDDDSGCMAIMLTGASAEVGYNFLSGAHAVSPDYGIDGSGIEFYGATNADVHHNTVVDCVTLAELGHASTADNTLHHNIYVSSLSQSAGLTQHGNDFFGPVLGTKFYHNTVYITGNTAQCYGVWANAGAGLDLQNNIFYVTGALSTVAFSDGTITEAGNVFYGPGALTLTGGVNATSIAADPLFADQPANLRVLTGSPAINRGADLGYTTDFEDLPIVGAPNSGAYETVVIPRTYFDTADWFWEPIPASPTLHANSSTWAGYLAAGQHSLSLYDYSTAVLTPEQIDGSTPRYDIAFSNPFGATPADPFPSTVPVPSGFKVPPLTTTYGDPGDGHYAAADDTTNKVYGIWQATPATNPRSASYGGIAELHGDGIDYAGDSTATKISRYAGVIRIAEIQAAITASGDLGHALVFASDITSSSYVYPAQKSDGNNAGGVATPMPQGTRVRLNMSVATINSLSITSAEKVILRTLAKYGAVCGDKGGARMSFVMELDQTATSAPGPVYTALGLWDYMDMTGASSAWSNLQVLESAPVTQFGTVPMTGSSTLAVVPAQIIPPSVPLVGSSSLSITSAQAVPSAVVMAGSGSLAVTPLVTRISTVAVAGTSSTAVTPAIQRMATVAMTSSSTLAITGTQTWFAAATFVGISSLSVTPSVTALAAANMPATSSMSVAGFKTISVVVAMTAASNMSVTGTSIPVVTAAFTGSSTMAVTASQTVPTAVPMLGSSSLAVTATVQLSNAVAMLGSSSMAVTIAVTRVAAVALTNASTMAVAGMQSIPATATFVGSSSLSLTISQSVVAAVAIPGASSMSVTGQQTISATVTMTGTSVLDIAVQGMSTAAVTMTGISSLGVTGNKVITAAVVLPGDSTLMVTPTIVFMVSVPLPGTSTMSVTGVLQSAATAPFTGSSTLAVVATVSSLVTIPLDGSSSLTITAAQTVLAVVPMSSASTFEIAVSGEQYAAVLMAGANTLAVTATKQIFSAVVFAGNSTLAVTASVIRAAVFSLVGTSTLVIVATRVATATIAFTGSSYLGVVAGSPNLVTATVTMTAASSLVIAPQRIVPAAILMYGSSYLNITATTSPVFQLTGTSSMSVVAFQFVVATVAMTGTSGMLVEIGAPSKLDGEIRIFDIRRRPGYGVSGPVRRPGITITGPR